MHLHAASLHPHNCNRKVEKTCTGSGFSFSRILGGSIHVDVNKSVNARVAGWVWVCACVAIFG